MNVFDRMSGPAAAQDSRACRAIGVLALAILFGLAGFFLIGATLESGRLAAFWLGNALAIGILLRRPLACQITAISACFLVNTGLNLYFGDDLGLALALSVANGIEIGIGIYALQRLFGAEQRFDTLGQLGAMALVAGAAPALAGLIPAIAIGAGDTATVHWTYARWLGAHSMPIAIFTPLMLIARDPFARPEFMTREELGRWASLGMVLATLLPAIFFQKTYPFLFLAGPIVIFAAFRTGRLGTAVAVAVLAIVASIATFQNYGPISLVKGGVREEIIALQVFLASCVAIGLPVATILANRSDLRSELEESRNFIASIVDGIGDIVFKVDGEWRWTYLNQRWAQSTGIAIEDGLGQPAFSRILAEDRPRLEEWKDLVASKRRPPAITVRARLGSGKIRHATIGIEPQFDRSGQFVGGIGTLRDVTDKIAQSDALVESEKRFRRLSEASPVGIFQSDAQGRIVYVNSEWMTLTGLEDGEWEDGRWTKALHPEDASRLRNEWRTPKVLHEGSDDEVRWIHEDGSVAWGHIVFRPVRDSEDQLTGYVGVVSDITARKQALEDLHRREEQLALLADNATDAVVRLSLDGTCIYASPSAIEVFGVSADQLIGHQLITGFHPEDNERVTANFATLREGGGGRAKIAFRSLSLVDGVSYNWLEANCGVVRNPETGEVEEIIASLRNVNETKQLEADLVAARDAAQLAAEAKSAFLANMSHEIRTPMNGVIGFTELALAGDLSDEQRQNLEMIADSGRAMLRLLNDLLDLAKIESGQMKLAPEPTDLRHKIRSVVRLMEPVAIQKSVTLDFDVADNVPQWLMLDPTRIRQIVLNLIGNGLKFTDRGRVFVHVSRGDPSAVRIAVHDTGIGIEPDRLALVFDKFTQADETITRRFGGTGLGLPISADLAELMNGRLTVESEPGRGSIFTLEVPCSPCDGPVTNSENALASSAHGTEGCGKILVAEDNLINQQLTLAMIEKLNGQADLAENGEEAIRMVEAAVEAGASYTLVLMDMQMPEVDGLEATRRLRKKGVTAGDLPIVALTANAYAEDIAACHEAGMQGHLAKPLRMRDLEHILARWAKTEVLLSQDIEQESDPRLVALFAERKTAALHAVDEAMRRGNLDAKSLGDIASLLHQIAGVAAFFGDASLGEFASEAEHRLEGHEVSGAVALLGEIRDRLAS